MNHSTLTIVSVLAFAAGACGSASSSAAKFVPPSPLGAELEAPHSRKIIQEAENPPKAMRTAVTEKRSLTLDAALSMALRGNKSLSATAEEVTRAGALIDQASLVPNPELSVDAEDFLGSGIARGVSGIQVTTSISQPMEFGGKRRTRKSAAELDRLIAAWSYEIARVALICEVKKSFFDLLAAQQRKSDADDMVRITKDVLDTFNAQMEAGKLTAIEINNAKIALAMADIEAVRTEKERAARRSALCAFWGGSPCDFDVAAGSLDTTAGLPNPDAILPMVEQTPEMSAAAAQIEKRKADIEVERAVAVPNVSFSLGYRWINDPGDSAVVAGAAVPLPFGNRNQGMIKAAEIALSQAEIEREATRIRLTGALLERIEGLSAAWTAAERLKKEVLPLVTETLDAIREGNRLGRFGYLDMLKAEETLFRVREDMVSAETQYYHALAEVERIIARPLINQSENETATAESSIKENKDTP